MVHVFLSHCFRDLPSVLLVRNQCDSAKPVRNELVRNQCGTMRALLNLFFHDLSLCQVMQFTWGSVWTQRVYCVSVLFEALPGDAINLWGVSVFNIRTVFCMV